MEPNRHEKEHILGLDLGQASDPSALTVTRKRTPVFVNPSTGEIDKEWEPRYGVVGIRRFDLGTPYPEVVRRVAAVQRASQTGEDVPLVMDATGIGAPVVDQFKEEGLDPVEILFTGGNEVTKTKGRYAVPKKDLATTVQAILQAGRLQILEDLKYADQLTKEMRNFRVKISDSGHARFEHATESKGDDVLLSLACALWYTEYRERKPRSVSGAKIRL